ncbi:hypothetical protein [Rhodalgimonas zhirmunskyi]|uniref:Alpha/beta hydrolase n=1 Tax=Rhodalgimonas zhirmunskyi TaxID=2964767 RepID=A0AAJ1UDF7_9RHOB|nr:hypothetical protein [Rhodoalgimonas zhirmunskyi]MDQ2093927.1 hypothetical protein [Rhodoalgimonas zhirmunskyi]
MRFFSDEGLYAANCFIVNDGPLVFTFDNMSTAAPLETRPGWGHDFFKNRNINVVSLLESNPRAWYRRADFLTLIDTLRKKIDLENFEKRISYGGSMGGYAAAAFSPLLKCDTAILLNPISTLSVDICPWEVRYEPCKSENWSHSYHDAAAELPQVPEVYIVVDSLFPLDRKHVDRFRVGSPSAAVYRMPGFGHGVEKYMNELGVMKPFVMAAVAGHRPDRNWFANAIRGRRRTLRYYERMLRDNRLALTEHRKTVLIKHLALTLASAKMTKPEALEAFIRITRNIIPEEDAELLAGLRAFTPKNPALPQLEQIVETSLRAKKNREEKDREERRQSQRVHASQVASKGRGASFFGDLRSTVNKIAG